MVERKSDCSVPCVQSHALPGLSLLIVNLEPTVRETVKQISVFYSSLLLTVGRLLKVVDVGPSFVLVVR